jgi:hypothetical protein
MTLNVRFGPKPEANAQTVRLELRLQNRKNPAIHPATKSPIARSLQGPPRSISSLALSFPKKLRGRESREVKPVLSLSKGAIFSQFCVNRCFHHARRPALDAGLGFFPHRRKGA